MRDGSQGSAGPESAQPLGAQGDAFAPEMCQRCVRDVPEMCQRCDGVCWQCANDVPQIWSDVQAMCYISSTDVIQMCHRCQGMCHIKLSHDIRSGNGAREIQNARASGAEENRNTAQHRDFACLAFLCKFEKQAGRVFTKFENKKTRGALVTRLALLIRSPE